MNLLLDKWEIGATSFSDNSIMKFSHNYVDTSDIQQLQNKLIELSASHFFPVTSVVRITRRTILTKTSRDVSYEIRDVVITRHADARVSLVVHVANGYALTIEDAIESAQVYTGSLLYNDAPIESGKGQINKCKKIANDILLHFGNLLRENQLIKIPYATRGGRGGWKEKIAERSFTASELSR